jgi:hypothetical protein
VDVDIAGDMRLARQKTRIVFAGGLDFCRYLWDVVKLPELDVRAQGQTIVLQRHSHRFLEGTEMGIQVFAVGANDDQLAGLIGRHQQRDAKLVKNGGKIERVDAAQRFEWGVVGGGRFRLDRLLLKLEPGLVAENARQARRDGGCHGNSSTISSGTK